LPFRSNFFFLTSSGPSFTVLPRVPIPSRYRRAGATWVGAA
jgi:hypothetical protein